MWFPRKWPALWFYEISEITLKKSEFYNTRFAIFYRLYIDTEVYLNIIGQLTVCGGLI